MKKLVFSLIFFVLLALGEGGVIFYLYKSNKSLTQTTGKNAESQKMHDVNVVVPEKKPEAETQKSEISEQNQRYDTSVRTYKKGENGRFLYEEGTDWGEAKHYAFNMEISGDFVAQIFEYGYQTLNDCALVQRSIPILQYSSFIVTEYITGKRWNKEFACFKVKNSNQGILYLPYSSEIEGLEFWEDEEDLTVIDGKKYRVFPFSGYVWYDNGMSVYEKPVSSSPVAFVYDYEKLGIAEKRGYDYCPQIMEAAIALDSDLYWVKVKTEIGEGWVSEKNGNVERGGPVYNFPEDRLSMEFSHP